MPPVPALYEWLRPGNMTSGVHAGVQDSNDQHTALVHEIEDDVQTGARFAAAPLTGLPRSDPSAGSPRSRESTPPDRRDSGVFAQCRTSL